MASGLRARASEARAIQARWRERKSKRRVTSKDSLFHHHHPNFYNFFPRAIAPLTGSYLYLFQRLFPKKGVLIKNKKCISRCPDSPPVSQSTPFDGIALKLPARLSFTYNQGQIEHLRAPGHNQGCGSPPEPLKPLHGFVWIFIYQLFVI